MGLSNKDLLNQANPNNLADVLRRIAFGDVMRQERAQLRRAVPSTNVAAGAFSLSLPTDAKAAAISRATAIAGTGTLGELVVDAANTAPAAGHCAVTPSGDIIFNATDAFTVVDVAYVPERLDVLVLTVPVAPASGVAVLPAFATGIVLVTLMSATITLGTNVGACKIVAPGAVPGTTLNANLSAAKAAVQFRIADAVTQAQIVLGMSPAVDLNAILSQDAGGLL